MCVLCMGVMFCVECVFECVCVRGVFLGCVCLVWVCGMSVGIGVCVFALCVWCMCGVCCECVCGIYVCVGVWCLLCECVFVE